MELGTRCWVSIGDEEALTSDDTPPPIPLTKRLFPQIQRRSAPKDLVARNDARLPPLSSTPFGMDFKRLRAKHNLPRALLTETDIGAGRQSAGQPTPARRNVRGNATSLPELPAYQHALLAPVPLPRRPQPCLALAALKMHRDVLPPSIRWHSSTCQVLRCTCQFAPWNRCARALSPRVVVIGNPFRIINKSYGIRRNIIC